MTNKNKKTTILDDLGLSMKMPEHKSGRYVKNSLILLNLSILVFIAWASLTKVKEVANTEGEVVPSDYVQVVQHLDGGIVKTINVKENQLVEAGDILVQINNAGAFEDLQTIMAEQRGLLLRAERIQAFIEGRELNFSNIPDIDSTNIKEQQQVFSVSQDALAGDKKAIEDQLKSQRQVLSSLISQQKNVDENINVAKEVVTMAQSLFDNGSGSKKSVLDAKSELNSLKAKKDELQSNINQTKRTIGEFENRLSALDTNYRNQSLQELDSIKTEIAGNAERIRKMENRVDRESIMAPIRGIVKGLNVTTIGGVITPGEKLMEIVPVNDDLIIDVKIAPRHIGHVIPGQPVRVKVSAFDFTRYGKLNGVLKNISATTFADDDGRRYYTGRISIEKNYVGSNPDQNILLPGMTVQADIITGEKTILSYLLKPVHVSLQSALTER